MVLPGLSGKKYLGRVQDDLWGSGVRNTKDPRPVTQTEKEILAAYEEVQAASKVTGTEAQLLWEP